METAVRRPQYRNPIIDADWPDPDAIRVGDDFYLTASSFNRTPGLPVLHSRDLVNWTLVSHALPHLEPAAHYALPRHGSGVWAPSIRHHEGRFHIVYPDPDQGIWVVSTDDPHGRWDAPRLLVAGLGLIDPCPLWDDDGSTYLVHGWAGSRAGRKNRLDVIPVDAALTRALGPGRPVVDGDVLEGYSTLEGPKFYKRDGWYWIFAPAGGVATGWQSVFRSRTVYGPYEDRIVLAQGDSATNGPHQGAWVDTEREGDWFLHFQDRGPWGRVVHLQPMRWTEDGWPVIGDAAAGAVAGTPVVEHPSPFGAVQGPRTLTVSDDFARGLDRHWRWQGNPQADWADAGGGTLRLTGPANDVDNARLLPQVLAQPVPGFASTLNTRLSLGGPAGSRAGLIVLGRSYVWAGLRLTAEGARLQVGRRVDGELSESLLVDEPAPPGELEVAMHIADDGTVAIDLAGIRHDGVLELTAGHWIGADAGVFAAAPLGAQQTADAVFGPITVEFDHGR